MSIVTKALSRVLGEGGKRTLKSRISQGKQLVVRALLSYDRKDLQARLRRAGIAAGDTLLVHANFPADNGFRGTPLDLVNALAELVTEEGNLVMVSIPFRGSAYDHLMLNKVFNVRKTMSMMGLVTEMFRRREGTLRSLHPTHPVLAVGKDAAWLVGDHERCRFPCGPGSPFEKLHQKHAKILFFDVSFGAITFFHYVEHLVKDRLPFPVYHERVFQTTVVDARGASQVIESQTFSTGVVRKAERLERKMIQDGRIRAGRVGNSRFLLVTADDVVSSFSEMVASRNYPYELEGSKA